MSNEKKERITTPAGIAKYAWLNKPDTKFKKEGQFKVTLVLDESDDGVTDFLDTIRSMENAAKTVAKRDPKKAKLPIHEAIRPHLDEDGQEVEGKVEVTFKTTASGTNKKGEAWTRQVRIFDAKGKPCDAQVGSGSKIKVSFTHEAYATSLAGVGIALYLEAVQVIDLVEFKSASADQYGFGEEEGYASDESGSEFSETPDESSDESADETPEEEVPAKKTKAAAKSSPKASAKQSTPAKGKSGKAGARF